MRENMGKLEFEESLKKDVKKINLEARRAL